MRGITKKGGRLGRWTETLLVLLLLLAIGGKELVAADTTAERSDRAFVSQGASIQAQSGYAHYIAQYQAAERPEKELLVPIEKFDSMASTGVMLVDDYEGMKGPILLTDEESVVRWEVEVPVSGLYHMALTYYPMPGKSSAIERILRLDGELPFKEAAYLQFDRLWVNEKDQIVRDNQGNDLRPRQVERPEWSEKLLVDSGGYETSPFSFHLTAGKHTLELAASREPMAIKQLKLFQRPTPLPYAEVAAGYDANIQEPRDVLIKVEAEDAVRKSSPTLYPTSERASAAVTPYHAKEIRINTIGGHNWRLPGQWIEWEIEVPQTGYYQLAFKVQQNFVRGMYATRMLTIDGQIPFAELEEIPFLYQSGYRIERMGEKEPYRFYLTEGTHTLRLEASLGAFAPLIREVEESLYELNAIYRKILMITGTKPDEFRDYQLDRKVPGLLEILTREKERLTSVADEIKRLAGQSSDQVGMLRTMMVQLEEMLDRPDTIHRRLDAYKINTGGLGTWIQQSLEQPLEIDALYVASMDKEIPRDGMGLFSKLGHELSTFFHSFTIDYNQIGNITDGKDQKTVTVWIGSGRDQANTMKAMIDETFTAETGINVNLKLVNMYSLLPATLAGQGPDIAMQIDRDIPVNYAMRNAAADLAQFTDYEQVLGRFRDSAVVPYRYEQGVYALPETQTFDMLFYRKDVLEELGLEVPRTWDEVAQLLAVLSKNHMEFGLPQVVQGTFMGQNIPPNSLYGALLYQNGGEFYRKDGRESDLDSRIGIETFKQWTEFYTDYKLEREYDFANRFRTGQMPIGIVDYTMYNQLSVFAPEIRGMWSFAPLPGTPQENGNIRLDIPSGGTAVMMLENAKDKDAAWEFMKWWTRSDTQTTFGREMEGLMGAAARYPTANIEALDSLPWPVADYESLKKQFETVRGVPEVPGGYFTGRHLFNAFYRTVIGQIEPRESIMDYVQFIQDEITVKRREFDLPL